MAAYDHLRESLGLTEASEPPEKKDESEFEADLVKYAIEALGDVQKKLVASREDPERVRALVKEAVKKVAWIANRSGASKLSGKLYSAIGEGPKRRRRTSRPRTKR